MTMIQKSTAVLVKALCALGSIALLAILLPAAGLAAELPTEPAVVTLTGRLNLEPFLNEANGKVERHLILHLDTPIDVAADRFDGPVKGIRKLQLAAHSDAVFQFGKAHLHERVSVRGSLFHAWVASHHFTDILIHTTSIALAPAKRRVTK